MKQVFRYATLLREPGPGAVPKNGLICCGYTKGNTPKGRFAWGWADYERKLTDEEVSQYELEYIYNLKIAEGSENA